MNLLINANAKHIPLADESVNCVVTSPPYYGLRSYLSSDDPLKEKEVGLEQTPDDYVQAMCEVFDEIWRVLRNDGVAFLNLGDSYSSGVGSNVTDCMESLIKGGVLFIGGSDSLTITSQCESVLCSDGGPPDGELFSLFGLKRIFIKQRNNNFGKVIYLFNPEIACRLGKSLAISRPDDTSIEIVLDEVDDLSIIIPEGNLNKQTSFGIAIGSFTTKDTDMSFTIKKTAKPITEGVSNVKPIGNTIPFNAFSESILDINLVNQSVSFGKTFMPDIQGISDFSVTESSHEHFAFSVMNGLIKFTFGSVRHLSFSNQYGSIIRYKELYDKAKRKSNSLQQKQELGIPEMVKRSLMENGWICRQTIIWHKPNPMPESVKDRCTKAHEYIFLLTKSARYWYDNEAIFEPANYDGRNDTVYKGSLKYDDDTLARVGGERWPNKMRGFKTKDQIPDNQHHGKDINYNDVNGIPARNKRSVWTVTTKPYPGSHYAVFPPDLIEPCILAGCPKGGVVLDPFIGSGTTCMVARKHRRKAIGLDLNYEYLTKNARERLQYGSYVPVADGVNQLTINY